MKRRDDFDSLGTTAARGRSARAAGLFAATATAAVVAAALLAGCESAPLEEAAAPPTPASSVEAARSAAVISTETERQSVEGTSREPDAPPAAAILQREEPMTEAIRPIVGTAAVLPFGAPSIRFKMDAREPDDEDEDNPLEESKEIDRGTASWYGLQFHGRQTANGERFNMYALTAAHKTLPFGTIVRVRSLQSGRSVDVRINDRGPYVQGRVIDLSKAAAEELGIVEQGLKPVSLTVTEWPEDVREAARLARKSVASSGSAKKARPAARLGAAGTERK